MRKDTFQQYLKEADFQGLFISEMGWNNFKGQSALPLIEIEDREFPIETIAMRSGFQLLTCAVHELPSASLCKKLDLKIRKSAYDYICIFYIPNTLHHLWVAPVKNIDKRDIVCIEYQELSQTDFLFSKIPGLSFGIDEQTTIVDVKARVQASFSTNSERVTKDFYSGFKKEHSSFSAFIQGIDDNIPVKSNRNKQWYASVMLNRLMFCYFIQKKGFLDNNFNYLTDKLRESKQKYGDDQFFSFYKNFLMVLFRDGLNAPKHKQEFEKLCGRIPYLNGGMFDEHQIEQDYKDISIPDQAFESLFAFFDKWNWHLDTRITATGRDINPDVLGYIFEQYINDRAEMGAYYTKEDITEYIGRNCILPFLFDKAASKENWIWEHLKNSGDRYIFDAVKKGYSSDWRNRIPAHIACGLDTSQPNLLERRALWNTPTPAPFALPTEIWRETIERLTRCENILHKIESGEIRHINDFITYNLDIRQFALDLLEETNNHLFVLHFYHALQSVTILDPTCGSGAFLFAAMNILEPLYEVCIERMQEFNAENPKLFVNELGEIQKKYRSNIQYFIYKSIILRNLYGVDIMHEATEIAKLRLFLKMVAVVDVDRRADNMGLDPLPDIDFNIRCGNTLVGYATEQEVLQGSSSDLFTQAEFEKKVRLEMQKVSLAYHQFRKIQLEQQDDMVEYKQAKADLTKRLHELTDLLDRQLFSQSGQSDFLHWQSTHQPFHWIAEYYSIIQGNGGFDVIIGNPPYVVYNKKDKKSGYSVADKYKIRNYSTATCNNLYAFCIERSIDLLNNRKNIGMIVPLSMSAAKNMSLLRDLLIKDNDLYVSTYEIRPAKLFDGGKGADQRLNIFLSRNSVHPKFHTTQVLRWKSENRKYLFSNISYTPSVYKNQFWRFSNQIESCIIEKLYQDRSIAYNVSKHTTSHKVDYRSAGLRYWIIFLCEGFGSESASNSELYFNANVAEYYMCALNSNLYWWYYANNYDMFNLTVANITDFPLEYDSKLKLERLSKILEADLNRNKQSLTTNKSDGGTTETFAFQKKYSKQIIDEIDKVLAKHYGFTEEELDFIINYDIKYRMGDELNNEE